MRRIGMILVVLGLVATVVTATAVTATAQEASEAAAASEQVAPEHQPRAGALWAKGVGHVDLDVRYGRLGMKVRGDVVITGPADLDVIIDDAPYRTAESVDDGGGLVIVLEDFAGRIGIRGENFEVSVDGGVALHGVGKGTAVLDGEGVWRTRHNRGTWPETLPLG